MGAGGAGGGMGVDLVTPHNPSTHVSPSLALTAPCTPSPQDPSPAGGYNCNQSPCQGGGGGAGVEEEEEEALLAEAVGHLNGRGEGELAACARSAGVPLEVGVISSTGDAGSPSPRYDMQHLLQTSAGMQTLKTESL